MSLYTIWYRKKKDTKTFKFVHIMLSTVSMGEKNYDCSSRVCSVVLNNRGCSRCNLRWCLNFLFDPLFIFCIFYDLTPGTMQVENLNANLLQWRSWNGSNLKKYLQILIFAIHLNKTVYTHTHIYMYIYWEVCGNFIMIVKVEINHIYHCRISQIMFE